MPGKLLTVLSILLFVWLAVVTFFLARLLLTFKRISKDISKKDLREILNDLLNQLIEDKKLNGELEKKIEELKNDCTYHLQKTGFVRYNPFAQTGGNQSFVLALLDGNDSGFVITSLHSRESTRVFAKPVKLGKEDGFEFSKEEIQAILSASKKKIKSS